MGLEPKPQQHHYHGRMCCDERSKLHTNRKSVIDYILKECEDEDKNVQMKTIHSHISRKMPRGPMSFVTRSQRLDDVDPLYGFNVVATFGPFIAGQQNLKKDKPNGLVKSCLSTTTGNRRPSLKRKQVRFSDRLICRQFSRSEEETVLGEEKLHKKILRKFLSKGNFSRKKLVVKVCPVPDVRLTWYLESEYSLSFVSGLYPEEIAALTASQQNNEQLISKRKLSDLPIPEEDELVEEDDGSICSDSFTVYENSLSSESMVSSEEEACCEKNTSYDTIPSNASDSGYERSQSSSLNNLKDKWPSSDPMKNELSLIDNLYNRAQSEAERNIAESLSKMNIPEWALKGIKLSNRLLEQESIAPLMTRSDDTTLRQMPPPPLINPTLVYSNQDLCPYTL